MASYSTNEFKSGLKLMIDNDPCSIIENEFVKPGKGQAFNRVKLRNLLTGRVHGEALSSPARASRLPMCTRPRMQYLYSDGTELAFHGRRIPSSSTPSGEEADERGCEAGSRSRISAIVTLWNNQPILVVTAPNFVTLDRVGHRPGPARGDTSSGGSKAATPRDRRGDQACPFSSRIGERLKVDTRSGEYVSRVPRTERAAGHGLPVATSRPPPASTACACGRRLLARIRDFFCRAPACWRWRRRSLADARRPADLHLHSISATLDAALGWRRGISTSRPPPSSP